MKKLKISPLVVGIAFVTFTVMGVLIYFIAQSGCSTDIVDRSYSPDAKLQLDVFQNQCGSTKYLHSKLAIRKANSVGSLDNDDAVFVIDDNNGAVGPADSYPNGGPKLTLQWTGYNDLRIEYPAKSRVIKAIEKSDDINILYVPSESKPK